MSASCSDSATDTAGLGKALAANEHGTSKDNETLLRLQGKFDIHAYWPDMHVMQA